MFAFEMKERTKGHLNCSKRTERVKKRIWWKTTSGRSKNDKRSKEMLQA